MASDEHVCNDKSLLFDYYESLTDMNGVSGACISLGRGKAILHLALKDNTPGTVMTLTDVMYMPQCPANLVSNYKMAMANVYWHSKDWEIYHGSTKQVLGYAQLVYKSQIFKTLDHLDIAVHLFQGDNETYQWPGLQTFHVSKPITLTKWHVRLGHLNFVDLKRLLIRFNIPYLDDASDDKFFYHSCEMAKATKKFNRTPQPRPSEPFQKIHTNMVGKIKPSGMLDEIYFFTFTDAYSRFTISTQQGIKMNGWVT